MNQPDENLSSIAAAPARGEGRVAIAGGCLAALGSALLTCGLLFVNGSLVLAILEVFSITSMEWVNKQGISQFALFALPVAMVVVEWMMIDYVRTRFTSRQS